MIHQKKYCRFFKKCKRFNYNKAMTVFQKRKYCKATQKNNKTSSVNKGMRCKEIKRTDLIFYVLIFIIFFLALIKSSFPKYFNSIFSLSFQATFRQTQTREQMSQNFFPAFMLNVLFILSGGLFITLFAQFYKWTKIPFWQLFVYSTVILGIVYSDKIFCNFFYRLGF